MHLAVISVGTLGHVLPTLPFVAELRRRGIRITYFTTENLKAKVIFSGADFVPFDSLLTKPEAQKNILHDIIAELPLRFLSEADHVIKQVLPVLERDRPDAILYDTIAIAGRLAANALDVPAIQIYTSYAPNAKFSISRTWPSVADAHPARIAAKKLAEMFTAKYGVPHLDVYEIFEGAADLNIVLLQRSFHPAGDIFDKRYVFAGAQIAPRDNSGTWQAPGSDKPLIFSSLGTMFNNWPEFYVMLFDAVKDLPVNVAAAIGTTIKPGSLGTIPQNVIIAPYLPQLDVLAKSKLFITHAGTGSVMESIWFGVPMIGIPQMPEQIMTAMRIEELGLGKAFPDRNRVTSESLRVAIEDILNKKSFRNQIGKFQEDMKSSGGYELTANTILEFLGSKTEETAYIRNAMI
jgi:MGT family glycosyltransferase